MDEAAGNDDRLRQAAYPAHPLDDAGFDIDEDRDPETRFEPYQDPDYGEYQLDTDYGHDQFDAGYSGDDQLLQGGKDASLESDLKPQSRVLVIDRKGELSLELVKAAAGMEQAPELLRLNRPTQLVEVVAEEKPHAIIVAPAEVTQAGFRRLAEVHRADPRIVILLSDHGKTLSAVHTAESGVSGILPASPTRQELRSRLARALHTAEELRKEELAEAETVPPDEPEVPVDPFAPKPALPLAEIPVDVFAPSPVAPPAPEPVFPSPTPDPSPAGAFAPTPTPDEAVESRTGLARIFSVTSASGGSGKTFLAINLATYLVKATGGKVLLVDLDLQFGEVAVSLQLRPQGTIAELLQEENLVAALTDYLADDRSGFKVLSAPRDPLDAEKIGSAETTAMLDAARGEFDFIVIDTPSTLNETSLAAFDQSEVLVLMATMDLPSLKHMRLFIETLEQLQTRAGEISLILNKVASGAGIDLQEVESIYPKRFIAVLPYAKEVLHSTNFGVPVLLNDPHAEISRKLADGFMKLVPPSGGVNLPWSAGGAPRRFPRLLRGKGR